MNRLLANAGTSADPRFPGIMITGFDIPSWAQTLTSTFLVASSLSTILIFGRLFLVKGHKPDLNFLVSWASFLIWWIPVKTLPEYYLLGVPFFHSLQYLLFASKMEDSNLKQHASAKPRMIVVVVCTILAGVAGFELIPAAMDIYLTTSIQQSSWFFMSIAGVFFNIHHFFIDSAVWKFDQIEVKRAFFSESGRAP